MKYKDFPKDLDTVCLGYYTRYDLSGLLSLLSHMVLPIRIMASGQKFILKLFGGHSSDDMDLYPVYGAWNSKDGVRFTFTCYILTRRFCLLPMFKISGIRPVTFHIMRDSVTPLISGLTQKNARQKSSGITSQNTLVSRLEKMIGDQRKETGEYGESGT